MAVRDTKFFKLLFGPVGAISQFFHNPTLSAVVIENRFFPKRPILRLIKYILPQYRAFSDDNTLIEQLYKNQAVDVNIKRLLTQDTAILPSQLHDQLGQIDHLPPNQKEEAFTRWVERVEKSPTSTVTSTQAVTTPQGSSFFKNLSSQGQIILRKGLTKISPQTAATIFSSGVGIVTGYGTAGSSGAVAGGVLGAAAPSFIKRGGGEVLLRGGGAILNTAANLLNGINLVKVGIPILTSGVWIWAVVIGLGLLLLIGLLGTAGLTPTTTTPGVGATPLTPYTPGAGAGIISCPVINGAIVANGGSKDTGGHCSPGYQTDYPCVEPDVSGRATAVDIKSFTDRMVFLPYLNKETVNWFIEKVGTDTQYFVGGVLVEGGYEVIARAQAKGKTFHIRFVHLELPVVLQGQSLSSNTLVGQYRSKENHLHITIQEDNVFQPADLYFNLCQ